jgi:hypothetical protein
MSNNKWIPQWKKDKEAAEIAKQKLEKDALKGMEFTETNFPELPKNPAHISRKVFWEKSFVNLATDWKTESEKRSKEEDIQSEFKRSQMSIDNTIIFPQFANNHTFVEEEEEEEDKKTKDSDWTLVSRQKNRRKKTFEEIVNRPTTPNDDEDGAWKDQPAEHETCWDIRP